MIECKSAGIKENGKWSNATLSDEALFRVVRKLP